MVMADVQQRECVASLIVSLAEAGIITQNRWAEALVTPPRVMKSRTHAVAADKHPALRFRALLI